MSHTLSTHIGFCNLYAASVAHNAFIADLFIFSAVALPVLAGTENTLTEQTVFLRFQGPVIDGLRLFYFAAGPL